ncbi:MAG: DNA repair protein RecO [Betaproteobacteria bacterium]
MAARAPTERHDSQAAFVLHTYAYRETSLIVEAFTADHGRVAMVARGAKRPRSETRGLLQAFQPLTLSWAGGGELKTLLKAEWGGGLPLPRGAALLCGFYLNELLLKLLAREDPHAALYRDYQNALAALCESSTVAKQGSVLRRFELRLLAELGYELPLTHDAETGAAVDPSARYHYEFGRGPRAAAANVAREPGTRFPRIRGATLLGLAANEFPDAQTAAEARMLMRDVLDHYLEERRIFSRRVVQDLQAIDEESETS